MIALMRELASKGPVYWASVFLNVLVGVYLGHRISETRMWMQWRYLASHAILQLTHRVPVVKDTTVITIGNDEYWTPQLSARSPINRAYLARLVSATEQGNPFLIALDFDMRSPQPDGPQVEFPDFEEESRALIAQIRKTARKRHVVLPRTIWYGSDHSYRLESDIWNLDPDLLQQPNVHSGYIALPPDLRQVPMAVPLENSEPLDSFSLAIARAKAENVTDLLIRTGGRDNLPFASYVPETSFPTHTAQEVFSATPRLLRSWFNGRLVIIGAAWNIFAAQRGPRSDSYLAPAGVMPGVFIHANFVEALLDQRTFEPVPEWLVGIFEAALVVVCVLVLALNLPARTKVAVWTAVVVCLMIANYVALQNLGRFFDFFVPLVMVIGHLAVEQVNEWRKEAHAHRRCAMHTALVLAAFIGAFPVLVARESDATVRRGSRPHALGPGVRVRLAESASAGTKPGAPAKPRGSRPRYDRRGSHRNASPSGRKIDGMGQPAVGEGVGSADPHQPGGARRNGRDIDPMGQPVVGEGVKTADPGATGGARRNGVSPHDGDAKTR